MPTEEIRRRRKSRQYDVLIVPHGEVSPTRTIRTSRPRLILFGFLIFLVCVAITLAALVYTPVAMYVPIPNPALEQRYGRQIVNLQERLNSLAEDVLLLRDYNVQLRKALGENAPKDSVVPGKATIVADEPAPFRQRFREPPASQPDVASEPQDLDLGAEGPSMVAMEPASAGVVMKAVFPLFMPVEGIPTQGFDPARGHFGIDIAAPQGRPISAASDGIVIFSGWTYDDGNMLIISHGEGYLTVYKHAQSVLTTARMQVKRGEPVALVGSTGRTSLGPHLHFEVWKDGTPCDPEEYLLTPIKIP